MYVKTLVLTVCLTFLPIQQQINDQGIPLVFGPRAEDVVILPKSEVERLSLDHVLVQKYGLRRVNAARDAALGTAITNEVDKESLTVQEVERFRWHRRPLQWRRQ